MTIAVNDAGDVLTLDGDQWKPAVRAMNDKTGETLVLDGGAWKPLPRQRETEPGTETGPAVEAPKQSVFTRYNEPGTETGPDAEAPDPNSSMSKILGAAGQAWQDTPPILTPKGQEMVDQTGPIGRQIINPALKIAGAVPAAAHAGMAALSQSLMQVFGEKGGRDALALLGSIPMVHPEMQAALSRGLPTDPPPAEPPRPQFVSERTMPPDEVGLTPLHRIQQLIAHDDMENGVPAADRGAANQSLITTQNAVMGASDLGGAIEAASKASGTADYVPVTVSQVAARDGVGVNEAYRRMVEENAARRGPPPAPEAPPVLTGEVLPPEPQSVGAAASREQTPQTQIDMTPTQFAANRLQGEVERLASPPSPNDTSIYIPGTRPTLAEVTGDPKAAVDQKYSRQQPEAMQSHIEQENHNAGLIADYYADTAGSRTTVERLERERETRAEANKTAAFGAGRAAADPTPVIDFMDGILNSPEGQERNVIRRTIPDLIDRFYQEDGALKTDPLSLYGIRKHIGDLLDGAGDPETSSASRTLRRELMQIRERLDAAIEQAAPDFAKYREEYARDSREIDAMKLLQEERLSLLNKDQHITPAKWFSFMRNIVEGRNDPMDPAFSLSEEQMDRLWNITNHLKRQTFIDAGNPRGSHTSQLLEWGKRLGMHGAALAVSPGLANLAVPFIEKQIRARSVAKEMNRVLNPPLGGPQ